MALLWAKMAVQQNPGYVGAHRTLMACHAMPGRVEAARQAWAVARQIDPTQRISAESEAKRPPIPTEDGQRFRSKAATHIQLVDRGSIDDPGCLLYNRTRTTWLHDPIARLRHALLDFLKSFVAFFSVCSRRIVAVRCHRRFLFSELTLY